MRRFLILFVLFNPIFLYSQYVIYNGTINKQPIKLFMYQFDDGYIVGVYCFNKYNTPINFNGDLNKDTLTLYENCNWNKYNAIFRFYNYKVNNDKCIGEWINQDKYEKFEINLNKRFSFDYNVLFDSIEILQETSTKEDYFMALSSNYGNGARVYSLRVYDKKSNKLKQEINLDYEYDLRMFSNVSVQDYNLDGIEDFGLLVRDNQGNNPTGQCYIKRNDKYVGEDCSPKD